MKPNQTSNPAPAVDGAAILKAVRAEEKLEAIRAHGGLCEKPMIVKLIGPTPIGLKHLLAKIRTSLSQAAKVEAGEGDFLNPEGFLALGVGDLDLLKNDGAHFAIATDDEIESAVPAQTILAGRAARAPKLAAEALFIAAQRDVERKVEARALANKAHEGAVSVLEVAQRGRESETERYETALEALGLSDADLEDGLGSLVGPKGDSGPVGAITPSSPAVGSVRVRHATPVRPEAVA